MTIREKGVVSKIVTVCCAVCHGSCIAFPIVYLPVGILKNAGGSVSEHVSVLI